MKLLLISESPYNFNRNGKISKDLLDNLSVDYDISGIFYNHNIDMYEDKYKEIKIFPYSGLKNNAIFIYETFLEYKPDIVLYVGNPKNCLEITAIKRDYPTFFKLIGYFTIENLPIDQKFIENLKFFDSIIFPNKYIYDHFKKYNLISTYINYGTNIKKEKKIISKKKYNIFYSCLNKEFYNPMLFLESISELSDIYNGNLHIKNINGKNDFNFEDISKKYKNINIFNHNKIDLDFKDFNYENYYENNDIYIDCSIGSCTSISLLESINCNLIPISSNYGFIGNILRKYNLSYKYSELCNSYMEKYNVGNKINLINLLKDLYVILGTQKHVKLLKDLKNDVCEFNLDNFILNIKKEIIKCINMQHYLYLEEI